MTATAVDIGTRLINMFADEFDPNLIQNRSKKLPFDRWLPEVTPAFDWTWDHLMLLKSYLGKVTAGDINRLAIFMPPRHGKSELVTIRYPVWRLQVNPRMRVILGAYNQPLADKFSRQARKIAAFNLDIDQERRAVEDWLTEQGGGMRAIGVGSGITGQGGHLIIIDDPVKSRAEAESPTYRDRVWTWYTNDLYTRLEPKGQVILIQTRWHEDDLAGRILNSPEARNWTVLSLPALCEDADSDLLHREVGAALCPQRYDVKDLEAIEEVLGSRDFSALYQQRPLPATGALFDSSWFRYVPQAPRDGFRVRYWDKAGTEGGGKHSAGVLMLRALDGRFYVEDVVRGQWSALNRELMIRQTTERDALNHGLVYTWFEEEGGSGGKESAQSSVANLAGFIAGSEHPTGSKVVRARPFSAQVQAGNVFLVQAPWNTKYVSELCAFPAGRFSDQVDASSGAFMKLAFQLGAVGFMR